MTASDTLDRGARAASWPRAPQDDAADVGRLLVRAAGILAAAFAAAGGAVITLRRLAGAIDPAEPALLLGAVAAGIALVFAADAARRAGASLVVPVAVRSGLVLATATLAFPPRASGYAGWIAVAAAAVATAVAVVRVPTAARPVGRTTRRDARSARSPRRPASPAGGRHRDERAGILRQRFERRELPAGVERVRGRVVVAVPAGARTAWGHLGFCPAFPATPTVAVTTAYDGVEATVTAAEVLPWGVRVECRLSEPADEPLEIPVDLVADAPPASS